MIFQALLLEKIVKMINLRHKWIEDLVSETWISHENLLINYEFFNIII